MQGYSGWSYAPYTPPLFDSGDIYICRVAPGLGFIHAEWLPVGGEYEVYVRERGKGDFRLAGRTAECSFDMTGLKADTDHEFYVRCGEKKSRVRLARTGFIEGTVINYLHPDDGAYAFSGRFLCSPSWVRLPGGRLIASMDVFGSPQLLTLLYYSDDDGKSWHYLSELMPCYWGKLFLHGGDLYMLSCSTMYGDLLIGKSTDGGRTFGTPTALLRGGSHRSVGVHRAPQNLIVHNGRIYAAFEWGSWKEHDDYYFATIVASCDINDDLLAAENWRFSEPLKYDPSWKGAAKGVPYDMIEGTLVKAPDGRLMNIMRYNLENCEPNCGLVIAFEVDTDDPDAPEKFSRMIEFPANESKFIILFDEVSKKYWTVATRIDRPEHSQHRNLMSLMVSDDLYHWRVAQDIFDYRGSDPKKVGFQYVDFGFEGDDILFACRTAMNGADTYHNSNCITFHRISGFRETIKTEE